MSLGGVGVKALQADTMFGFGLGQRPCPPLFVLAYEDRGLTELWSSIRIIRRSGEPLMPQLG